MGDALFVAGGVTTPAEARLAAAGLLTVQGPGALDVRTGVMAGPGSTALVTGTSSTSPMRYSVASHHWVTSRGAANGPYQGSLDATQLVDTTVAPASGQSRIDVIWVKQQDATAGIPGGADATTAPLYGCTQGTSTTGTPTKPSIPVGAEELATATVSGGATATNGAGVVITNTARQTVARGAVLPVTNATERLALSTAGGAYDGLVVVERSTDRMYEYTGTAWRYIGGGTPPTTLLTVNGGWNADSSHKPQYYLDGSGLVHPEGWWTNGGAFTVNASQYPITFPVPPAQTKVWLVPFAAPAAGYGTVVTTLLTDGRLRIDGQINGPSPIPANTLFFLDGLAPFHPATPGTAALS